MNFDWMGLNRTWCGVLEELRALIKAGKPHPEIMLSLVEELQVYGNRMEAGLEDKRDLRTLHDKIKKAKKQLRKLEAKIKEDSDDE